MRVESSLVGLLVAAAVSTAGCHRGVLDGHDPHCACEGRLAYNLPPAARIMEPGPGVGGPGPGVIPPVDAMMGGVMTDGSVIPAGYGGAGGGMGGMGGGCGDGAGGAGGYGTAAGYGAAGGGAMYGRGTSQVAFLGADGTQVSWDVSGVGTFDSVPLVLPGRQDFLQGAIYRLRLSNIPGREGVELFPTLEVAPVTPRTDAYLAHSPIPVQFTEEDFDQVLSGNFVTKVIYLPDPEFQEITLSGVETLVSTRLDPGVDPIAEADRRGSILAIVRMGNKDLRSAPGMANYSSSNVPSGGVVRANYQYDGMPGEAVPHPFDPYDAAVYGPSDGEAMYPGDAYYYDGAADGCYGGDGHATGGQSGNYDGAPAGQMPLGMPTAGFAPAAVPPHMIAGGPTWGMPITGTPIGLPGPPHVPLGHPAGLQKHVMRNRTRVVMPPPVTKMTMTVKQRPGMNYPRPVNRVSVDEVHREPGGLVGGWLSGWFNGGGSHH